MYILTREIIYLSRLCLLSFNSSHYCPCCGALVGGAAAASATASAAAPLPAMLSFLLMPCFCRSCYYCCCPCCCPCCCRCPPLPTMLSVLADASASAPDAAVAALSFSAAAASRTRRFVCANSPDLTSYTSNSILANWNFNNITGRALYLLNCCKDLVEIKDLCCCCCCCCRVPNRMRSLQLSCCPLLPLLPYTSIELHICTKLRAADDAGCIVISRPDNSSLQ